MSNTYVPNICFVSRRNIIFNDKELEVGSKIVIRNIRIRSNNIKTISYKSRTNKHFHLSLLLRYLSK
jgi:hypothetical protein